MILDRLSLVHCVIARPRRMKPFPVMIDAIASSLGSMMVGYECSFPGQAIDGGGPSAQAAPSNSPASGGRGADGRAERSPSPGRETTITLEAKAWLTSLSCRKAKELGYPHELWTTRLLARHAREHGPAKGQPVPGEHENGRRASSRARLVLRRLKGRGRKSSPSSVRMSKAYGWTSSSCLRKCRTLKSRTPSTPRMTASPSTN